MIKRTVALVAITIITASILPAPNETEARNIGDGHSTLAERNNSPVEARTTERGRYKKRDGNNTDQIRNSTNEVRITTESNDDYLSVLDQEQDSSVSEPKEVLVVITESLPISEVASVEVVAEVEDKAVEKVVPTKAVIKPEAAETPAVVISKPAPKDTPGDTESDEFMVKLAGEIHRLTNIERERAGMQKLQYDSALAKIAKSHSKDMAENDYFSHTDLDGCTLTCRFDAAEYEAWAWGENIAWRSSSTLDEAKVLAAYYMESWMNSDGHRLNILSDKFTYEGVGLARVGNKVYATVNFAKPQ